ncbi:MAG: metallophosphoesterase [Clostridia bacterium]|nr:metallophosphoesterase [Clostridia bacterium]
MMFLEHNRRLYDDTFHAALREAVTDAALPKSPSSDYGTLTDWGKVWSTMTDLYPELSISREGLRSLYRRHNPSSPAPTSLKMDLLGAIKRPRAAGSLMEEFQLPGPDLSSLIASLVADGYRGVTTWVENGTVYVGNIKKPRTDGVDVDFSELTEGRDLHFAVVSDTHLGSKYEALDELRRFYRMLEDRGIDTVYHVGDLSEGYYSNRPVSIFDTHAVGFTEQVKHIVANYPKGNMTTFFITGNHDATHFRNGFADIGEAVSAEREDLVYLGHNFAKVHLTPHLTMALIHPTDGVTNTLSLKLQHIIERNAARRADIMLVGHYHKSCAVKYRDVYGYLVPSFQHVTPFMADNNLYSDVAGMIFTARVDKDGRLLSIVTEYVDMS